MKTGRRENRFQLLLFAIVVICYHLPSTALSQRGDSVFNHDTTYFDDVSQFLNLRPYLLIKYNTFRISDEEGTLILAPNSPTTLGMGFNFKGLGIALGVGLPVSQSKKERYGTTSRFDFQANVYGSKFGIDGFLQIYKGYYNTNPEMFIDWEETFFPQLPDMQILSAGGAAYYIFNSKRFSFKAPFIRTQIQRKSAGSAVGGIYVYHDQATTDSGFVPNEYPDSLKQQFTLRSFKTTAYGVSAGYMYTFVIKRKFFIHLAGIPGIGYRHYRGEDLNGDRDTSGELSPQIILRLSMGYENPKFYLGLTASVISRSFAYQQYTVDLTTENVRVYVGKRFDVGKRKNK